MNMFRVIFTIVAAALLLAACGSDPEPVDAPDPDPAVTIEPAPESDPEPADRDPYDVYLELTPEPDLDLSRDDALARALLGCGTDWPAGTVDAALAEAYGHLCP